MSGRKKMGVGCLTDADSSDQRGHQFEYDGHLRRWGQVRDALGLSPAGDDIDGVELVEADDHGISGVESATLRFDSKQAAEKAREQLEDAEEMLKSEDCFDEAQDVQSFKLALSDWIDEVDDFGDQAGEQSSLAEEMLSEVPDTHEITIEGISGEAEAALDEAHKDLDDGAVGIALSRDINIHRLTEQGVRDLLDQLETVRENRADYGDHERAKAALGLKKDIRREARSEGIIDE